MEIMGSNSSQGELKTGMWFESQKIQWEVDLIHNYFVNDIEYGHEPLSHEILSSRMLLPFSLQTEFHCQHNTKPRTKTADKSTGSKSTNCPVSLIIAVKVSSFQKSDGKKGMQVIELLFFFDSATSTTVHSLYTILLTSYVSSSINKTTKADDCLAHINWIH